LFIIFGMVLMILCDLIFVLNKKEIEIELMKRNGLYLVYFFSSYFCFFMQLEKFEGIGKSESEEK